MKKKEFKYFDKIIRLPFMIENYTLFPSAKCNRCGYVFYGESTYDLKDKLRNHEKDKHGGD